MPAEQGPSDFLLLRAALSGMGAEASEPGPADLQEAIRQAGSRYRSSVSPERTEAIAASVLGDEVNADERNLFGRFLRAWDSFDDAIWTNGTSPYTPERRALAYELLGISQAFRDRCDAIMPVAVAVESPILIADYHETWYDDARSLARSFYWGEYSRYLRDELSWPEESVQELGKASRMVVERLSDPERTAVYQTKGLVVGYVQSGKTANFTAVLARCADAGYRLFIVLSGTLNILREQTQRRIDKELIGREIIELEPGAAGDHEYVDDGDWHDFVSHGGVPEMLGHFNWERLTGAKEDYRSLKRGIRALEFTRREMDRRFNDPVNLHASPARLIVVKKNPAVLRRLCADLGRLQTRLAEVPALIIDDESDQASLNTKPPKASAQKERTATNEQIVNLLKILRRAQYVGYTATPFANVLVDPSDAEDLFPKDYVLSLGRPPGYMGVRDYFDLDESGTELSEEDVPSGYESNERAFVRSVNGEDEDEEHMPRALDSFVMSGAVKLFRRDQGIDVNVRHHTMLVHKSFRIDDHRVDAEMVTSLFDAARYGRSSAYDRLEQLWEHDFREVSKAQAPAAPAPTSFSDLRAYLDRCVSQIARTPKPVLVVNGEPGNKDDTPNFDRDQVWNVLVGGTKLSRGYTIEGLTVSYYRRKAKAADTLMQMGRWFGFRSGYRDLVRLFIGRSEPDRKDSTFDLYEAFKAICLDEEAFRKELRRYAELKDPRITPREIPPLVPSHMLPPTSRNKMYNARVATQNLGGRWTEITVLPTTAADKRENCRLVRELLAGSDLLDVELGGTADGTAISWGAVSAHLTPDDVLSFLHEFHWEHGRPLERVLEFLRGTGDRDPDIGRWLFIAPQKRSPALLWGPDDRFGVLGRSRVGGASERFKVFSEPRHRAIAAALVGLNEDWSGLTIDAKRLQDPHAGVFLFYPVVEKGGGGTSHSQGGIGDDRDVSMGFALLYPRNRISGPPLTFTVVDPSQPDAVVIDARVDEA